MAGRTAPSARWTSFAGVLLAVFLASFGREAEGQVYPPNKPGFPITIAAGGNIRAGHPVIADLGLVSNRRAIVFGTSARKLFVVLHDGTVATGFPKTLPAESSAAPAVGDITGGGAPEIVVSYGSTFEPGVRGGVDAYTNTGAMLWRRMAGDFAGAPGIVNGSPAIGDVDGDGFPEVVWGSVDGNVYVVDGATGNDKPGWPVFVRDTVQSSPALHDIDGDGKLDIVIGVDAHKEAAPFNTPDGGCLYVFRFDGSLVTGFPRCLDQVVISSPAIGDIDGDGAPEIVVGTGTYWPSRARRVYAFHCNGLPVTGWPITTDNEVEASPALADLDGDGAAEVVVTDTRALPSDTLDVYVFNGDGSLRFKRSPRSFFGNNDSAGAPMIADVTGDSRLEILVPTATEIAVFSDSGTQLTDDGTHFLNAFSYYTETPLSHVVVGDLEVDNPVGNKVEVVAVSATAAGPSGNTRVYCWNPKAIGAIPWGLFHQNARRTGVLPGTTPCGSANTPTRFYTLEPCRVLDTRDPVGPYGGPAIPALTSRAVFFPGRCGIPSDAVSISGNVTVVTPSFDGNLRAYPGSGPAALSSILNYRTGQVRPNNAILRLGAGEISFQVDQGSGTTHLLVDVNGYFR